jgi:Na+/melibiose symporter-like transporter
MTEQCIEHRALGRAKKPWSGLYAALTTLSFHWSIVIYINSSYLEQFLSERDISVLYIAGAMITILCFFAAPRMLQYFGNYTLTLFFGILECISLLGMAFGDTTAAAALWFTVHSIAVSLLLLHADIFMEDMIGAEEGGTGAKRGLLLTIMSFMAAAATLVSGFLLGNGEPRFVLAYTTSALMLVPFLLLIMQNFRTFKDPAYPRIALISALRAFWSRKDIRNVFCATFLLQLFFVWMVIYVPLYMEKMMGFDWETIGAILFVGLLAYALFEWPIGLIADRWLGEKEMMAVGFLIIAVATSWIAFLKPDALLAWFVVMFVTRIGGSLVETTTESYFFKHTEGKDASLVSLFRVTRPLSYVIGAFLGGLTLSLLPTYNLLFVVLGFLMIPGLFFAMALRDTK